MTDPANRLLCGLNIDNPSSVPLPTTFKPTLNYASIDPSNLNPVSNLYTADPPRQAQCASDPNSRSYCKTQGTQCTAQAEILAYYDEGSIQPNFQLNDDSYTNANAGINLTFLGALPYSSDSFKCTEIDPGTGFPVERSLNVFIGCDKNVKGLNVIDYTERGQCQYYITATSAAACGSAGDPYDGQYFPKDMAGLFFGTVLLIVPFCYIGVCPRPASVSAALLSPSPPLQSYFILSRSLQVRGLPRLAGPREEVHPRAVLPARLAHWPRRRVRRRQLQVRVLRLCGRGRRGRLCAHHLHVRLWLHVRNAAPHSAAVGL